MPKKKITTKKARKYLDSASNIGSFGGEALTAASVYNPELLAPATALYVGAKGARKISKLLKPLEKRKRKNKK